MHKINCPKCKYSWKTKSKLKYITCPSCQRKTKNIHIQKMKGGKT